MTKTTDSLRLKALAAYSLLKATARAEAVDAQIKLDAMASAAVLAAASTANELTIAVQATLLQADAATGRFFFLFDLSDAAHTLETKHFDIRKLRTDEVRAVERALRNFQKALVDTATTHDSSLKTTRKALQSTAATGNLVTRTFAKLRQDVAITASNLSNYLYKFKSDTIIASDVSANLVGKLRTDTVTTGDAYSRTVAYVRHFEDSADATDAVSVVAITDDGQVMFLGKSLLDGATTSETHRFDMSVVRADTFTATEQALNHLTKPRSDAVVMSDASVSELGKVRSDIIATADSSVADVSRVSADTVNAATLLTRTFTKSLSDVVSTADALVRAFTKDRQEGVATDELVDVIRIAANGVPPQIEHQAVADTYAPEVFKNFADAITVTDDFDGATTTEDSQTTAFVKGLSEPLFAVEQRLVALQKPTAESLTANDTGVLFWTNYCDSTYFSQGYVGQERSFS